MYTHINFKTKKALREAVAAYMERVNYWNQRGLKYEDVGAGERFTPITYYQPGPFGGNEPRNGRIYVEGPHYPEPHRWYAQCDVEDGKIVRVK